MTITEIKVYQFKLNRRETVNPVAITFQIADNLGTSKIPNLTMLSALFVRRTIGEDHSDSSGLFLLEHGENGHEIVRFIFFDQQ